MTPLPPFATPLGPSCFYFYHIRTAGGTVTDMSEGFHWNIDSAGEVEPEHCRILRLTEHLREARKKLLHQEFDYSEHGEFEEKTLSLPLYRHMRDEWAEGDHAPTDDAFVVGCMKRILRSGTGNIYDALIEHEIVMLTSSIMAAGCAKDVIASLSKDGHVSLEARVRLELGSRTTDDLSSEDAPAAVWIPREDRTIQERLARTREATQRMLDDFIARAAAQKTDAPTATAPPHPQAKKAIPVSRLGRHLTRLLRHQGEVEGLTFRSDGYTPLESLFKVEDKEQTPYLACFTTEDVLETVKRCEKQRMSVVEEEGQLWIRANQGHSIATVEPDQLLTLITSADEVPICLHGTYFAAWELILKTGLDRMQRNDIQMAVGLPGENGVKSGIRGNIEVLIYIDVARAMESGIPFYRSENNVICSPGPIPVNCFAHVCKRDGGATLLAPAFQRVGSDSSQESTAAVGTEGTPSGDDAVPQPHPGSNPDANLNAASTSTGTGPNILAEITALANVIDALAPGDPSRPILESTLNRLKLDLESN